MYANNCGKFVIVGFSDNEKCSKGRLRKFLELYSLRTAGTDELFEFTGSCEGKRFFLEWGGPLVALYSLTNWVCSTRGNYSVALLPSSLEEWTKEEWLGKTFLTARTSDPWRFHMDR